MIYRVFNTCANGTYKKSKRISVIGDDIQSF